MMNKKIYLILCLLTIIGILCCLNTCSAVEDNNTNDNYDWTGVVDGTQIHVKTPQPNEDVKIVKIYYNKTLSKPIKKTKTYKGYFTTGNDGGMLDLSKTKNVKKHLKICFDENCKYGMDKNLKKAADKYYNDGDKVFIKVKAFKTNSKYGKDYDVIDKKITKWKTIPWQNTNELWNKVRKINNAKYKFSHNTYANGVTYSHFKYETIKPIKKYYKFKFSIYTYKVTAKVKYTDYKDYQVKRLHHYSVIGSKSGEFARLNIDRELYYL